MNDEIQAKALRAARWFFTTRHDTQPRVSIKGWEDAARRHFSDEQIIAHAIEAGWVDEEHREEGKMKFEVGDTVWIVGEHLDVFSSVVREQDLAEVNSGDSAFHATEAEAHAEAVRRAHSIVNRAELARARSAPEDTGNSYSVYDEDGGPYFIQSYTSGWSFAGILGKKRPTPADAILAVIPESDR